MKIQQTFVRRHGYKVLAEGEVFGLGWGGHQEGDGYKVDHVRMSMAAVDGLTWVELTGTVEEMQSLAVRILDGVRKAQHYQATGKHLED